MDDKIKVHLDDDGSMWAEIPEMPGVFASGDSDAELREALSEAVALAGLTLIAKFDLR